MPSTKPYHHGNLQISLIEQAIYLLETDGVNGLSLRKLAERVGVSRSALYHHYPNKHALLCAVAAQGFAQWQAIAEQLLNAEQSSLQQKFRAYFSRYIEYAYQHPELYELMFGRVIWKTLGATEQLKAAAYPNFQYQLKIVKMWQQHGILCDDQDSLRTAQVIWGTLHGIAKLLIDGVYVDQHHIEHLCNCAVNLFTPPPEQSAESKAS